MTHDGEKPKRGPDGKFLPGHRPPKSPGRPPGANGIKARAAKLAAERLEQMLGRATEIISEELEDGNPAIAQWLIDRVRPPGRSDFIELGEDLKIDSLADIITTSAHIVSTASNGQISLQQAKVLQDVLERHAQFKGLEELAVLRHEIEKLRQARSVSGKKSMAQLPTWGRLSDAAPQSGTQDEKGSTQ